MPRKYKILIILLCLAYVAWDLSNPDEERPRSAASSRPASQGLPKHLPDLESTFANIAAAASTQQDGRPAASGSDDFAAAPPPPGAAAAATSGRAPESGAGALESAAGGTPASAGSQIHSDRDTWLPPDVGRQWRYVYKRERTRSKADGPSETETLRGTLSESVVRSAPEFDANAVEIQSTLRGQVGAGSLTSEEKSRRIVRSEGRELVELAREVFDPSSGLSELEHLSPPIERIQRANASGVQWRMGYWEAGGVGAEFHGEILGLQDAKTPAGFFEKCLVVRYRAQLKGQIDLGGSQVEVGGGEFVATEWYAAGVGRVMVTEDLRQAMTLADGSELEFEQRVHFALLDAGDPASAPPASPAH